MPKIAFPQKNMALARLLLFVLVFVSFSAVAQEPIGLHYWDDKSNLSLGAEYLSNNVYLGRKDTTALPYITTRFIYQTSWGGYAEFAPSYAPTKSRIDLFTLEAGYDRTGEHYLYYGFNVDKYFYNASSRAIKSQVKESMAGYLYYYNELVSPSLTVTLNFGKFTDVMFSGELDHEFSFLDYRLSITPTFRIQAGTQHYYSAYFDLVTGRKKAKKDKEVVANSNQVQLLNYEIAVPIEAQLGRWTLSATPTYDIPTNASTLTVGPNTYKEQISNTFYFVMGFSYHLPTGKHKKQ